MPSTLLAIVFVAAAAAPLVGQERPPLFLREDWTETPAALPIVQEHVANPDLLLGLHGPSAGELKKSHHDKPADDPFYLWSGEAGSTWAMTLRHRRAAVDLTGLAKVRWRARQTGFRCLHVVVRPADGGWLVSEQCDDASGDWRTREFNVADLRWRRLDIARILEGPAAASPDLSRVLEIGVTDLMRGGGTPASSRLDWIEVYGRSVPR